MQRRLINIKQKVETGEGACGIELHSHPPDSPKLSGDVGLVKPVEEILESIVLHIKHLW